MNKSSSTIICLNTSSRIDPLRFQCDIGRLGDALLIFDEINLVIQRPGELVTLIHWLGEKEFRSLITKKVIRIVFIQGIPKAIKFEDKHFFARDMPKYPVLQARALERISTLDELALVLSHEFLEDEYLPESWSISDQLPRFISNYAVVVSAAQEDSLMMLVRRLANTPTYVSRLSLRISEAEHRFTSLQQGLTIGPDIDPQIQIAKPDEHTLSDLNIIAELGSEWGLSTFLSTEIFTGSSTFLDLNEEIAHKILIQKDAQVTAFNNLCKIANLPRIQDAIYLEEIPGPEIVRLRETRNAIRFRQWLISGKSEEAQEILIRYTEELQRLAGRNSLLFSFGRLVGNMILSAINPSLGALAGTADWFYSNRIGRSPWHPKAFIDGELRKCISQCRAADRSILVPFDVRTLLRANWNFSQLERHGKELIIKFKRHEAETWEITYSSNIEYEILNHHLPEILNSRLEQATYTCHQCGHIGNLEEIQEGIRLSCSNCRAMLLPVLMNSF